MEILFIVLGIIIGGAGVFFLFMKMKEAFGAVSAEAMSKNSSDFLRLANETMAKQLQVGGNDLDKKKTLIDQSLVAMKDELKHVQEIVTIFEKDREKKFGELTNQIRSTAEQTSKLQDTTSKLSNALSSTSARGQWGQRMAEDILKLIGFIEGVNYHKEKQQATVNTRPDYTFLLPQGMKVNMDVKFPLDNYLRCLESSGDVDKKRHKELFLRDARTRIKEVTTRDYINPEEKTVDYVIVFIPNEQAYGFINEFDRELLDDALRNKVIVCSPLTLYAILAVIRQALDNFNLEKTGREILSLLGAFNKQWEAFINSFDKLGEKIKDVDSEFSKLKTTRRAKLERPLRKIEELRKDRSIPEISDGESDVLNIQNSKEE